MGKYVKQIHETFSLETGELTKVNKWLYVAEEKAVFVKIMVRELSSLLNLTHGQYQVIFASLHLMGFDTRIVVNKEFMAAMSNNINKKPQTIALILSQLHKLKIFRRINRGVYEINPELFWKQGELERLKKVEYNKSIELNQKLRDN